MVFLACDMGTWFPTQFHQLLHHFGAGLSCLCYPTLTSRQLNISSVAHFPFASIRLTPEVILSPRIARTSCCLLWGAVVGWDKLIMSSIYYAGCLSSHRDSPLPACHQHYAFRQCARILWTLRLPPPFRFRILAAPHSPWDISQANSTPFMVK